MRARFAAPFGQRQAIERKSWSQGWTCKTHVQVPGDSQVREHFLVHERTVREDEQGWALSPTPGGEQQVLILKEPGFYCVIGQRQTETRWLKGRTTRRGSTAWTPLVASSR